LFISLAHLRGGKKFHASEFNKQQMNLVVKISKRETLESAIYIEKLDARLERYTAAQQSTNAFQGSGRLVL
jgi:hypothetical protein